jgi:hypothetical protein
MCDQVWLHVTAHKRGTSQTLLARELYVSIEEKGDMAELPIPERIIAMRSNPTSIQLTHGTQR